MSNNHEDEFVAVRVQDPRIQNEGSWNSYVDYKIFLHTNSKAFTAKTSCVRRRYSEFEWLKKKLQKNAGLVPVPDLPGKAFFSFNSEDFLERRRQGLQGFLDRVVHMTVCLSDSQLHLFLQTQLPVGHIQDCVQGHTPYTVTEAILTYASSNRGLAQALEEDPIKEPSLTISYESMESPAPHQPCLQPENPELLPAVQRDPLEGLLEPRAPDSDQLRVGDEPVVTVLQKNDQLEAVVEERRPPQVTFFLGDEPTEGGLQGGRQIRTPVEVHSPRGAGFLEEEEELATSHVVEPEAVEMKEPEEEHSNSEGILVFTSNHSGDGDMDQEMLEHQVDGSRTDTCGPEDPENSESHRNISHEEASEEEEAELEMRKHSLPMEENCDALHLQVEEEEERVMGDEEDRRSLPSSNDSIVKVSDEESVCEEPLNGFMSASPEEVVSWSPLEATSRCILDLQVNGGPADKDLLRDRSGSPDPNCAGDLSENGDFSVLESSSSAADAAEGCCAERDRASEEIQDLGIL